MARGHGRIAAIAVVALTAVASSASAASATSFTINKQTTPDGDPTSFAFSWEGVKQSDGAPMGSGDFSLADGGSETVTVLGPGFYTVTEASLAGYTIADIVCDNGNDPDPGDATKIDLAGGKAVIELSEGEDKTCTFYNEKPAAAVPPPVPVETTPVVEVAPTVATPVTPTPAIQVAPKRVRSAAAKLVGPKRCVSNRYSVAVTGGPVRSVSFWVNGKRVKTMKARTGQRRFSANLPLRSPVARVEARVSFAGDARPRSRKLRTTIRRCAPRVVRPQFTG
jgi:hypothetical protein